jgi:hypothetical protein
MQTGLDNLTSVLSLDYAYMSDAGIRSIIALITQIGPMWDNMQSFIDASTPDYFNGGKAFGQIMKIIFDMNIAN